MSEAAELTVPSRQQEVTSASPRRPRLSRGTALTPMQMAFQLTQGGADFASVREVLDYSRGLEREAAEKAFGQAMAAAQNEMVTVAANATNPQTKSRYADYAQIDRALRPIYSKHGFSLSFNDGDIDRPDWVRIECYVSHVDGHTRTYHKDMPADGKGAKGNDVMTKTHAVGAAQSYAMRYLLRMIFNVAVGEEDKDGNTGARSTAGADAITTDQAGDLIALIESVAEHGKAKAFTVEFLKWAGCDSISSIPAARYRECVNAVQASRP